MGCLRNESSEYSTIATVKYVLSQALKRYQTKFALKKNPVLLAASFLHPSFKDFKFVPSEERNSLLSASVTFIKDIATKLELQYPTIEPEVNSSYSTSMSETQSNAELRSFFSLSNIEETLILDLHRRFELELEDYRNNTPTVINVELSTF